MMGHGRAQRHADKMWRVVLEHWVFGVLALGLTVFAIWGIGMVPFHPDEATQLYMSGDLERLFTEPLTMGYDPAREADRRQELRELDAPLTKYLLGLGRGIYGLPALPVDWDWGKTWEENERAGALPSPGLLFAGRLAVTLLLPFSLGLAYGMGRKLGGRGSGWLVVMLLGLHGLVLLHTRRAMAEGALVFGVLFAMWSFMQGSRYPWLAGLGMALAFNAKQSALALLPVGMLAVVWMVGGGIQVAQSSTEGTEGTPGMDKGADKADKTHPNEKSAFFRVLPRPMLFQAGWNLVQFLVMFGAVTFALNPLYWRNPVGAVQASLAAREDLLARQVADAERLAPGQVLDTPVERLAVILGHLYVLPLQFFEVGNYQIQTAEAEQAYLAVPGHAFLRGVAGGGVLLTLTLVGMVRGALEIRRKGMARSHGMVLLFAATVYVGGALLLAVPLPYQRYSMPLLPLAVLWMGVGCSASSVKR